MARRSSMRYEGVVDELGAVTEAQKCSNSRQRQGGWEVERMSTTLRFRHVHAPSLQNNMASVDAAALPAQQQICPSLDLGSHKARFQKISMPEAHRRVKREAASAQVSARCVQSGQRRDADPRRATRALRPLPPSR